MSMDVTVTIFQTSLDDRAAKVTVTVTVTVTLSHCHYCRVFTAKELALSDFQGVHWYAQKAADWST